MRIGTPDFMPSAEIDFSDGTKILIPQPQLLTNGGWENISRTAGSVARLHEIHQQADLDSKPLKSPLWARVCVALGLALLVAASVFILLWGEF